MVRLTPKAVREIGRRYAKVAWNRRCTISLGREHLRCWTTARP